MEYDPAKDAHDSYYAAIQAKRIAELERERDDAIRQFGDVCLSARQRVGELQDALRSLVDQDLTYVGPAIHIPAKSHGDAIGLISRARAVLARKTL